MSTRALPLPGAEAFVERLELQTIEATFRTFPDGESYVRCLDDLAGCRTCIVAALRDPDPQLMRLLLAASAMRDAGAEQVGLVAPYLPYLRQDIAFHPGEAVSAKVFGTFLSSHFDWVVTVDPHLHRLNSLSDVLSIPGRAVSSAQAMARWIRAEVDRPYLIGPDQESQQWLDQLSQELGGAPNHAFHKTRHGDRDVDVDSSARLELDGYTPVLIDDIASTGQSILKLLQQVQSLTGGPVACCVTHALYDDAAGNRLRQAFEGRFWTTNTLPGPDARIDVSPSVLEAITALSAAR